MGSRSTGFRDVALHANEGQNYCGPALGCVVGCATFWCCCKGFEASCCGSYGKHDRLDRIVPV